MHKNKVIALFTVIFCLMAVSITAQQKIDEEYTAKIREFTTDAHFNTPYMDNLPYSATVPTPAAILGHIAGAPEIVSYSHEIYNYMRKLDEASPRVKVVNAGTSEEGRERILVLISEAETLENIEKYKEITARLADPRGLSKDEAERLIDEGKPFFWTTGAMHSPELGSPEMLMELAYRLAVDEGEFVRTIRENSIVIMTPLLEVDGRDKQVDLVMANNAGKEGEYSERLLYWGKYIAHDNNRDNMGLSLTLSRHILDTFFEYHPQVQHDLHESVAYLYISTGTGPFNAWLDPIVVDEWHKMAYIEVDEMTKFGVPGVWLHNFYDGWSPTYGAFVASSHNSIGRFYETQRAANAKTSVLKLNRGTDRQWYRPSPPLKETLWSFRNNINLQGSAVQVGMHNVAKNKKEFLTNFYMKSKRSVEKATTEGPAAYIIPASNKRPAMVMQMLEQMDAQGIEIHKAKKDFKINDVEYKKGSVIIRMDQPYSRMADNMLDRQYFNMNDRPYDDLGWTMGPLYNVETVRVEDIAILDVDMEQETDLSSNSEFRKLEKGDFYVINHNAEIDLGEFIFQNSSLNFQVALESFEVKDMTFNAGSVMIDTNGDEALQSKIMDAASSQNLTFYSMKKMPEISVAPISIPKIALMHTWQNTQSEGWIRVALDQMKIPYDYISVHDARDNSSLRSLYDVILLGPSSANALSVVKGLTGDKPIPWKKSDVTPNVGVQASTDDMRGGLELEGVLNLKNFVKQGGLFITFQNSASIPNHFGFIPDYRIIQPKKLSARGSVIMTEIADPANPITFGYGETLSVIFRGDPVFGKSAAGGRRYNAESVGDRNSGRGSKTDPDIVQARARDMGKATIEEFKAANPDEEKKESSEPKSTVVIRYAKDADSLLVSGGIRGGEELAGTPAVLQTPLGDGHIIMFGLNPMWRHMTQGSFMLIVNALLYHDQLGGIKEP